MEERTVFAIRSKIWIENMEGDIVSGLGRYRILGMMGRLGSMHAAFRQLQMRYPAVRKCAFVDLVVVCCRNDCRDGKVFHYSNFLGNLLEYWGNLAIVISCRFYQRKCSVPGLSRSVCQYLPQRFGQISVVSHNMECKLASHSIVGYAIP